MAESLLLHMKCTWVYATNVGSMDNAMFREVVSLLCSLMVPRMLMHVPNFCAALLRDESGGIEAWL